MDEICREIVFDTETTGLRASDGDRIIELGAVELVDRFPTGRTFHVFVNPEGKEVHPDALAIHGISNEFLADKPRFSEILEQFEDFVGDALLVAHNASFDMEFVNTELVRLGRPPIDSERVIDTLQIARRKHPMGPNSLDALCSRYNVDNSRREKHGALLDSELLAEVYIELLGGRQATLTFDAPESMEEPAIAADASETGTRKERPKPLQPRLTPGELQRHREFISTLGDTAIWKKPA